MPPGLRAAQRFAVRTGSGPLRPIWAAAFEILISLLAATLRRSSPGASVYVRGSFATREPVYGLSDVDLILVLPESLETRATKLAGDRWQRLVASLPALGRLVALTIRRETDLAETAQGSLLTYGLDTAGAGAVTSRHATQASSSLALRPGLYGATADWRRVAGPERRPEIAPPAGADRWVPAWLELQCWWKYAFWACREHDPWTVADLCVKLVAEPARIWLWIEHGVRCRNRREALEHALVLLPAEEDALRFALSLQRTLAGTRVAPLAETLRYLVRMSRRLADRLALDAVEAGTTTVRLVPGNGELEDGGALPLVDWRARVFPSRPDEYFRIVPGTPSSLTDVADAASRDAEHGPRPALLAPSLLVLPTFDLETRPLIRAALRAVQSVHTDPVSFSVMAGKSYADFPNILGLSARHGAFRAATCHRAWLQGRDTAVPADGGFELGMLLSCARTAVFFESVLDEDPELPLTLPAIVERLAAREPTARGAVETIAAEYLGGSRGADRAAEAALAGHLADSLAKVERPDRARTI